MKHTINIVVLSLFAVMALGACNKRIHTPDTSAEKVPMTFSAQSQAIPVKADSEETFTHNDFGVCAIAEQEGNEVPYILWNTDALCQVSKSTVAGSEDYIPAVDAYWFRGFEYTFFGLAPYQSAVSGISLQTDSAPALAFRYNMGESCTDNGFMIAAENKRYDGKSSGTSQDIHFWHFFAKININIKFVDEDKKVIVNPNNAVTGIRLCNVGTAGNYVLSYGQKPVLGSGVIDSSSLTDFSAAANHFQLSEPILHIIPQDVSGFEMYIDFTMETEEGIGASRNFKLNLTFGDKIYYNYNEVYTWNITIGPKNAIGFNVTVTPWVDGGGFEFPIQ